MNLIPWRNKKSQAHEGTALTGPSNRLRGEMDLLFDRFFRDPWGWPETLGDSMTGWDPALDVSENDKEVTVRAEMPGIDPRDIDITVSGNVLIIAGEKKESTEHKQESYYHTERRYGSFRRSVELPSTVDSETVSADYTNGVLTVHVGKTPTATPKRIAVKAG